MTSFPPTALIFTENEEENSQSPAEDLNLNLNRSVSSISLGEKFAEQINARSDYQNVMLCRLCVSCGKSKGFFDKNTQTSAGPIRARASSSGGTDLINFEGNIFPRIHSPPAGSHSGNHIGNQAGNQIGNHALPDVFLNS